MEDENRDFLNPKKKLEEMYGKINVRTRKQLDSIKQRPGS